MVYLISDGKYCKIGWSINPKRRLKQLQTGHSKRLKLIKCWHTQKVKERLIHRLLWCKRVRHNSEYFDMSVHDAISLIDQIISH